MNREKFIKAVKKETYNEALWGKPCIDLVDLLVLLDEFFPDDMVMVPKEPTDEMITAGDEASDIEAGCISIDDELPGIYKAMIEGFI